MIVIKIDGTIETDKSHDAWLNNFIDWLESRGEYFGGGTELYSGKESVKC